MFLFFFFFYYKHWLLTQQLYTLLTRLIHILTLFIILCILISILLKMQTVQHNHLRYQQYACSFMLLKTSYIKWGNCKIKSVHSVWFAIAFVVWFEVQKYWGVSKQNFAWIDIMIVFHEKQEKIHSALLSGGRQSHSYIFLITLTNFRKFLWTELSIWHFQ